MFQQKYINTIIAKMSREKATIQNNKNSNIFMTIMKYEHEH
jgi:hypothetical protein